MQKSFFQLEVHQYANGKLQKLAVGRWRQKLGSSGAHQGAAAPRVGRPPPQRLWPTASWGRLLAVALTPNPPAFSNYKYQGFGCGPLHPFSLHFITSIFTLQATLSHLCYFQPTTSRNLTKKSPIQASYPLVQALHHEKVRQNSFGGV